MKVGKSLLKFENYLNEKLLGEAGGEFSWQDTARCLFPWDTYVPLASNYSWPECAS